MMKKVCEECRYEFDYLANKCPKCGKSNVEQFISLSECKEEERLKDEIIKLKQECYKKDSAIDNIRNEYHDALSKFKEDSNILENKVSELTSLNEKLKEELSDERDSKSELLEDHIDTENSLYESQELVEKLNDTIVHFDNQSQASEKENDRLRKQVNDKDSKIDDLVKEWQKISQDYGDLIRKHNNAIMSPSNELGINWVESLDKQELDKLREFVDARIMFIAEDQEYEYYVEIEGKGTGIAIGGNYTEKVDNGSLPMLFLEWYNGMKSFFLGKEKDNAKAD